MPATVALSACWLSVDLSWLGSSSSIDMKLLLSVQSKSFPSISNKARGTKVAANMPLSSSILDLSEPQSSYRHIVKVIPFISTIFSASLCFTGFREFYQVFNSTFFILPQREIDFCRVDAFIIKSCVFLLANLTLAAYVFCYFWQHDDFRDDIDQLFVIVCHRIQKGFDHNFQCHYVFSCQVQTANNRLWCMLRDVVGVCHLVCIFS